MEIFRKKFLRAMMTAFTASIFLNMGFFLLEIKLLGLDKDTRLMQNISKMLTGAAFEEERDSSTTSSTQNLAEEEYLPGHHSASYSASDFLIADAASVFFHDGNLEKGHLKTFCPPPES